MWFDFADGFLHDLDHFKGAVNMFFSGNDEFVDVLRLPLQLI